LNILLITYRFHPCSAIGAKRWSEFYNLSQNDERVNFTVLTANWTGKKNHDKNIFYLGREVSYMPPKSVNRKITALDAIKHPTLAIRSLDKSILSSWYKESIKWIKKNKDKKIDLVIASFGPIASVILGKYAKNQYNVPYILDLRDLISLQGQKIKLPMINYIDNQLDKNFTNNVDMFLTVSPTCEKKAKEFYKKNVITIYNGLENKLKGSSINLSLKNKSTITILYMGTLGVARNPLLILKEFNEYLKKNNRLRIVFKFASQDNPFEFINKKKLECLEIEWLGYLSKDNLEKEKKISDAFLLLEDQTKKGNENLTGKIFEYMLAKKLILISCNENSDIVKLIKTTKNGQLVRSQDDVKKFINSDFLVDVQRVNQFTREAQYDLMMERLCPYIKN
jgi:hypothetical protein